MAVTFVAISGATIVASGDITLSEPAGVAEGDLLVACIAYRSTAAFTLPSGWSLVATQQSSGNTSTTTSSSVGSGLMAYIVRGGSAPSLTFTRSSGDVAIGRIAAYRGVDRGNPYDTGSANTLSSNATLVTAPGITTAADDELLVMACCYSDNTSSSLQRAATEPLQSSWHERADSNTSTGADTGLAVADANMLVAGSTGEFRYTCSSSRHVCIVGAFRAAPTNIAVRRLVVAQRQSGGSNTPLTTGSFTPPNNCLLVVAVSLERENGAHTGVAISDSTGLTWTSHVSAVADDGVWFFDLSLWTAQVGTAASMTVTVSETTSNDAVHLQVFAVVGHHVQNPVGATANVNDTTDETCAMTLSSAPKGDSLVVAARCLGVSSGSSSATPGVGWWELSDENISSWHKLAAQARFGSSSAAVAWTDVDDANLTDEGLCAVALEINHAPSLVSSPSPMQAFLMR